MSFKSFMNKSSTPTSHNNKGKAQHHSSSPSPQGMIWKNQGGLGSGGQQQQQHQQLHHSMTGSTHGSIASSTTTATTKATTTSTTTHNTSTFGTPTPLQSQHSIIWKQDDPEHTTVELQPLGHVSPQKKRNFNQMDQHLHEVSSTTTTSLSSLSSPMSRQDAATRLQSLQRSKMARQLSVQRKEEMLDALNQEMLDELLQETAVEAGGVDPGTPVITESQFLRGAAQSDRARHNMTLDDLTSVGHHHTHNDTHNNATESTESTQPTTATHPSPTNPSSTNASPTKTPVRLALEQTRNGTIVEQQASIIQALTNALHAERQKRTEVEERLHRVRQDSAMSVESNHELRHAVGTLTSTVKELLTKQTKQSHVVLGLRAERRTLMGRLRVGDEADEPDGASRDGASGASGARDGASGPPSTFATASEAPQAPPNTASTSVGLMTPIPGSPPVSPTLARTLKAQRDYENIRHGIELSSTRERAAQVVSTVATVADTLKRNKEAAEAQVHRLSSRVEQAQQVAHEHERITGEGFFYMRVIHRVFYSIFMFIHTVVRFNRAF
jgi:hypothetical protein